MVQKSGYTLFEVVIYTALLALLLAASSSSAISLYRLFGVTRIERQIVLEGDAAMETMIRDIRNETSTNVAASVFALHPGELVAGDTRFFLSGTTLQRSVGAGAGQNFTAKTRITNLLFYYATSSSPTNSAEIITIRMTLEAGDGFLKRSKNFFGSAVARGTY